MSSFDRFLNSFDFENTKGKQFEHFVKWFLLNDPYWKTQTDEVWLWDDYPDRWGPDNGVDLVFRHKNGEIWAVQAKCYNPKYSITKTDANAFLSESNRKEIDKRLLIASTDKVGKNARQVCKAQEKPVTFYLLSDFEKAAIEYPSNFSQLYNTKPKKPPTPEPHQDEAIKAVIDGFKNSDRGQLIMACGTGKTFTTLWIKEAINAKTTLVLLPSLGLVSQTLNEWTFATNNPFEVLCVCSDETIGKRKDEDFFINSIQDVSFPTTTDHKDIQKFLTRNVNKVIFSTYQSSPKIAEAQSHPSIPIIDLVISDEAHRCTGETGTAFTTVLDGSLIKAQKRLFTTATPKIFTHNLKRKHSQMGVNIADMSNESLFGKQFHKLTFSEAIAKDLLTDYRVIIIGVDEPMIAQWIETRQLVRTNKNDAIDAKTIASQIGLIKAINDYDLKRMISFHSRVKKAELFASDLIDAIEIISYKNRPKGNLYSDYVSGEMVSTKRSLRLKKLKTLDNFDRGLLANARCLSEGIDVPSLDGVAFIDPKNSQIDIIQAVGRAIRKLRNVNQKKNFGTIILPVFVEEKDNAEESIQTSNFNPIWTVLNALKSHDEMLNLELGQIRTNLGRQSHRSLSLSIPEKIIFDLPTTIDDNFADALKTILIEKTTDSWDFWFGLLERYIAEYSNTSPDANYKTDDGFRLGGWVATQRVRFKTKRISDARIKKLESLKGWTWDAFEARWNIGFEYLEKYVAEFGDARPFTNHVTDDGYFLGDWTSNQRTQYRKGIMIKKHIKKLETLPGWVWDLQEAYWQEGFNHLKEYVVKSGHARPIRSTKTDNGFRLGAWVAKQRENWREDKLSENKINKLEALPGWVWDTNESQWISSFEYLERYVAEFRNAYPDYYYKTNDGFKLGVWVTTQRVKYKNNSLRRDRILKFEALPGWTWDALEARWNNIFEYLVKYVDEFGDANPDYKYKTRESFKLGVWVSRQRKRWEKNKLESARIKKLESLPGWVWNVEDANWKINFEYLENYVAEFGNASPINVFVTEDGFKLGGWVSGLRRRKDKLTKIQILQLESLPGWVWSPVEARWNRGFEYLEKYVADFGDASPMKDHITKDGFRLGAWVQVQRRKKNELSKYRVQKLESLAGWLWTTRSGPKKRRA
jgi:superfamily II DNA or RNA helicase